MSESTCRTSLTASSVATLLSNVTAAVRPKHAAAPHCEMGHTATPAPAPTAEQRSGKSLGKSRPLTSLAVQACKFTDRFTNHHHGGEVGGAVLREVFTLVSRTSSGAWRFGRSKRLDFFVVFSPLSFNVFTCHHRFLIKLCICQVALHPHAVLLLPDA
jgi:hypothetical protein